jgi:hypothetical protein
VCDREEGDRPERHAFQTRVRVEDERHADVAALVNRQAKRGAAKERRDRAG